MKRGRRSSAPDTATRRRAIGDAEDPLSTRQVAVVTGANRGLGLETARRLAQRGLTVVMTARDARALERARDELSAGGLDVRVRELDVADAASRIAFAAHAQEQLPELSVLVHNAGVSLDGFDARVVERTLAVNYRAPVALTDLLAPRLGPGANVVMVSSGMGELAGVGVELRRALSDPELGRAELDRLVQSFVSAVQTGTLAQSGFPRNAYRVSKLVLNAATRILARELGPRARVNAVCPGWVRTRMGGSAADRSVEDGASGIVWAATLGEGGPTGGFFRDGEPIDW